MLKKWNKMIHNSILVKVLPSLVKLISLPLKVGSNNPKKVEFQTAISLVPYLYGYNSEVIQAMFAQAWFETGDFDSNLFFSANNAFGMRVPNRRPSLRKGEYLTEGNGTFSYYANVTDSILDKIILDKYNNVPTDQTGADYINVQVYEKNYLPPDERENYVDKILNFAPRNNFFFRAIASSILSILGLYYIVNNLFR